MNRNDIDWRGYWPAVPTPFHADGSIDFVSLSEVVERYLEFGAHGILVNGSTGEWFAQDTSERVMVAQAVISTVGSRVPVVVGCTSLRVEESMQLALAAALSRADGVMISPPPYLRMSSDELVAFVSDVATAGGLPVMVYNIPRRVGIAIELETIERLADLDLVVAYKNSGRPDDFFAVLPTAVERLRVFGPNLLRKRGLEALSKGIGDGYIGGWELLGNELPMMWESLWDGNMAKVTELAGRERALDAMLWDSNNSPKFGRSFASQLKAALTIAGMPVGFPRRPNLPLDDPEQLAELRAVLTEFGVLVP